MQTIKIIAADPFFFEEQHVPEHELSREVYLARIERLRGRMHQDALDWVNSPFSPDSPISSHAATPSSAT